MDYLLLVKQSATLPTLTQEADMAFEEGCFEAQLPVHSYHYSGSNDTLAPLWTALLMTFLKYVFVVVAVWAPLQDISNYCIIALIWMLNEMPVKSMNNLPLVTTFDYGNYWFESCIYLTILTRIHIL